MIIVGLGALGIMILTWLGFPTAAAIATGLVIGLWKPGRAARLAAAAGGVAWGVLLIGRMTNGGAILETGAKLGSAMGIPGWAPFVATVLYPLILAASAAWFGQLVSPRREMAAGTPAATARPDA